MAHFAQIEDGVVVYVTVVNNEDIEDGDGVEQESIGIAFLKNLFGDDTEWVQTSYNNNFRKQYAPIGGTYNAEKDIFVAEQLYPSWALDENNDWQAPEPKPIGDVNHIHCWNEEKLKWIKYKCIEKPKVFDKDGIEILPTQEDGGEYLWVLDED